MDGTKRDSMACFLNATPSLERLFIDVSNLLSANLGSYILAVLDADWFISFSSLTFF